MKYPVSFQLTFFPFFSASGGWFQGSLVPWEPQWRQAAWRSRYFVSWGAGGSRAITQGGLWGEGGEAHPPEKQLPSWSWRMRVHLETKEKRRPRPGGHRCAARLELRACLRAGLEGVGEVKAPRPSVLPLPGESSAPSAPAALRTQEGGPRGTPWQLSWGRSLTWGRQPVSGQWPLTHRSWRDTERKPGRWWLDQGQKGHWSQGWHWPQGGKSADSREARGSWSIGSARSRDRAVSREQKPGGAPATTRPCPGIGGHPKGHWLDPWKDPT